jgi:catechol 2,3-dioxygenase-like lactoylglutathione lyase family enzyme
MKLRKVLVVVRDIERSRKYYHDLFGLETVLDNDGNMILTEGLERLYEIIRWAQKD